MALQKPQSNAEVERIKQIIQICEEVYKDPKPPLNFKNAFESLVATILSAQCTDARVNTVTPALFKAAPTPQKMFSLGEKKLISFIRPTGFFNAKAKNILGTCKALVEKYDGVVPNDFEALQKLPGVGRKTASVVMCQAFGVPAFPVDRHILRVANRLNLSKETNPDKMDSELRAKFPINKWIPLHLQLIFLGRSFCRPKPNCSDCPFNKICPTGKQHLLAARKGKTSKKRH